MNKIKKFNTSKIKVQEYKILINKIQIYKYNKKIQKYLAIK